MGCQAAIDRKESTSRPRGLFADTTRSPEGVGAASAGPDPTRPDPYPPSPPAGGNLPPLPTRPGGNRARGLAAFDEQVRAYSAAAFPDVEPKLAEGLVTSALGWVKQPPTHEAVADYVHRNGPATRPSPDGVGLTDQQRADLADAGRRTVELNQGATA